jgi:superfamily II DNA or RNA helicase
MTHVRLTGRLADVIYSMETTNTDFYAYQFKPVLKILNAPTQGILIADEVGLGKTIEAGLIWTELRSRFDYRRLMVLCPAFLRDKWRRELFHRFGIEADLVDATEATDRLQHAAMEGSESDFALIGSLQGLRPSSGWRDEEEATSASARLAKLLFYEEHEASLIDLLVIDEAHYLRNPETKTAELGRLMRGVAEHVILLSATPIHLRNEDLFQLLNLIDEETFQHHTIFEQILHANRPLVHARDLVLSQTATQDSLKSLLEAARSHRLLRENEQLGALLDDPPSLEDLRREESIARLAYRLETVNLTAHSINRTRKRDIQEWRVIRDPVDEAIPMTGIERQFYEAVTNKVRDACSGIDYAEGLILVTPQRQMSSSMPAALSYWMRRQQFQDESDQEQFYEDLGADRIRQELGPIVGELIRSARTLGNLEALYRHDSKYFRLRDSIRELFREHPEDKIVLFSYFRATLRYLLERLTEDDISCMFLVGGMDGQDRVLDQFQRSEGSTVLLSSEVGSEGIDLQFCRVLVNYDLPWNPMKIEQRIGRLDRLGQKSDKILIWNLFYEDTIDARIYRRLYQRLRIFENALGELEPILGEEIQKLTTDLFRKRLTPEQEESRIRQTATAIEMKRQGEEKLESEASHLVAYGDYILRQIQAAKDLNRTIRAEDLRSYVLDYFRQNYPGSRFQGSNSDPLEFDIDLSIDAKDDLDGFVRAYRLHGLTRLTQNRPDPVRCKFENSVIHQRASYIEVISQFHPLVRFVSDRLGQEDVLTYPAVSVQLYRSASLSHLPIGLYVFSVQRWSISGLRDIEKLAYAAGPLNDSGNAISETDAERLVIAGTNGGIDWPEAMTTVDLDEVSNVANEVLIAQMDRRFDEFRADVDVQNRDRALIQTRSLENHRDNQVRQLEEIREKHRRAGRDSMVPPTDGRIRALQNRIQRQLLRIERRQEISWQKRDICVGIINLLP